MTADQIAWACAAVVAAGLLKKVDKLYDVIVGTTDRPGLVARVARVERALFADKEVERPTHRNGEAHHEG